MNKKIRPMDDSERKRALVRKLKNMDSEELLTWILKFMKTKDLKANEIVDILKIYADDFKFDKALEKLYEGDDDWDNWCDGDAT
tara:strand:+ start:409 stop:660 length:252 start_codon:yes stop_codon:yes gene_type:complete